MLGNRNTYDPHVVSKVRCNIAKMNSDDFFCNTLWQTSRARIQLSGKVLENFQFCPRTVKSAGEKKTNTPLSLEGDKEV